MQGFSLHFLSPHIMHVNVQTFYPVTVSYVIFLEQFLFAFLYVSSEDMLTSYTCLPWLCYFHMLSISTQQMSSFCGLCKHGNEPLGHMDLAGLSLFS